MVHSCLVIIVTLLVTLDQVSPQGIASFLFGTGTKSNKGLLDMWTPNQESNKLDEGKKKIRFVVWNRRKQSWVQLKTISSSAKQVLQHNVPLNVIIHGYSKERAITFPELIAKQKISNIAHAYGKITKESNIVLVNWTTLATEPDYKYNYVVESVPEVGEALADLILKLLKWKIVGTLNSVHLVGFGVGAHVGGVAGKLIQKDERYGGKVGRITGLDPAGVGFDDDTGQKSLNKSISLGKYDAEFVDIIHCNLGVARTYQDAKWKGRYGSAVQAGHADFYPNGGTEQLGCNKVDDIIDGYTTSAEKDCHTRTCPDYFAKSIEGTKYVACGCQTYDDFEEGSCDCSLGDGGVLMGEPCTREAKGRYYLKIGKDGKSFGRIEEKKKSKPAPTKRVTKKPYNSNNDWMSMLNANKRAKEAERRSEEKNSGEFTEQKLHISEEKVSEEKLSVSDEKASDEKHEEEDLREEMKAEKIDGSRFQEGKKLEREIMDDRRAEERLPEMRGHTHEERKVDEKTIDERKVDNKAFEEKRNEEEKKSDDRRTEERRMQEERRTEDKNVHERKGHDKTVQERKVKDNRVSEKTTQHKKLQQKKFQQKKSQQKRVEEKRVQSKGDDKYRKPVYAKPQPHYHYPQRKKEIPEDDEDDGDMEDDDDD